MIALLIILALIVCPYRIYKGYLERLEEEKQWEQQQQEQQQEQERKQRREQLMITPEEKAEVDKAKELLNKIDTRLREEYKVVDRRIRHAQLDEIDPAPEDLDLRLSLMNTANFIYRWPHEEPGCPNCAYLIEHNQRALAGE